MLALDAATEYRSFSLLYDRYADRLYRCLLAGTGDVVVARELLDDLIADLPRQLQRYAPANHYSFVGWLFALASRRLDAGSGRVRRLLRAAGNLIDRQRKADREASSAELVELDPLLESLRSMPPTDREVLAVHVVGGLSARQASEALSLPTSLVSHHLDLGLKRLSGELGSSRTDVLRERLANALAGVHLDDASRQRHRRSVSRYYGAEETSEAPASGSMRRDIAVIVLVAFLGLAGLYAWDRGASWYESWTAEPEEEPVELASEPDPTPTPEPELTPEPTPTAEPELTPAPDTAAACDATESRALAMQFVDKFNDGDSNALYDMVIDDSDVDSSQRGQFIYLDEETFQGDEFLNLLQERHDAGEQWHVDEALLAIEYLEREGTPPADIYEEWRVEDPGTEILVMPMVSRTADDMVHQFVRIRAVVECNDELMLQWSMTPESDEQATLVPVEAYLEAIDELERGESRTIQVQVATDYRDDGGLLRHWNLTWTSALSEAGRSMERIDVTNFDGESVITYVDDGQRWWLDQRGWHVHGRSSQPPFPEEIDLVVPWLMELQYLLAENLDQIRPDRTVTLREDFSFTAGASTERRFEAVIVSGSISQVRLRRIDVNGESDRPVLWFLAVDRDDAYDSDDFRIAVAPRFPELEVDAPRYRVPVDFRDELQVVESPVVAEQLHEEHRISWNDIEMVVTLRPSSGGLNPESVPRGADPSWQTERADYSRGTVVWAHRHFAGFPTDAVWDTGEFRFELSVERDPPVPPGTWDLDALLKLVEVLSGADDSEG
jgi:DNA-directed RNA polymerase specialized sigma24 family protein